MVRVSNNLQRVLNELEQIRNLASFSVTMDIVREKLDEYKAILREEIEVALQQSEEYNYPLFRTGLLSILNDERIIAIRDIDNGVEVEINMDAVAGRLSSYINAVESVRLEVASGKATPRQATVYWKYYVYGVGREGREGFAGTFWRERENRRVQVFKGEGEYEKTIRLRLGRAVGLAPWWELLDKGVANAGFPSRGGNPYPNSQPTRFVSKAQTRMQISATLIYNHRTEQLIRELSRERFGYENVYDDIVSVVSSLNPDAVSRSRPGKVFSQVKIKAREYNIYRTKTGLVGLRLA